MKKTILLTTLALLIANQAVSAESSSSYKKSDDCSVCKDLDTLLGQFNAQTKGTEKLDTALKIAKAIRSITLKSKPEVQKREIYYAINATVEVLPVDFDSDTVIGLMDLRTKSPNTFDDIFHRFPMNNQNEIIERMQAAKTDKVRPKAQLPTAKAIEP